LNKHICPKVLLSNKNVIEKKNQPSSNYIVVVLERTIVPYAYFPAHHTEY
jgi:hypothetical protein